MTGCAVLRPTAFRWTDFLVDPSLWIVRLLARSGDLDFGGFCLLLVLSAQLRFTASQFSSHALVTLPALALTIPPSPKKPDRHGRRRKDTLVREGWFAGFHIA